MPQAAEVDSIDARDPKANAFLRRHVDRVQPCVLRAAALDWSAVTKWQDKHYLAEACGKYTVTTYPHLNYCSPNRQKADASSMSFAQALDEMFCNDERILSIPALHEGPNGEFSELMGDLGSPVFSVATGWGGLQRGFVYAPIRFFIYKNGGTNWHAHPGDQTLLCQIVGSKHVGLIPTNIPAYGELRKAFANDLNLDSSVPLERIGAAVPTLKATLHPGDALFIPPHWWHGVEAQGYGASAALCWRSPRHVMGDLRFPVVRERWRAVLREPWSARSMLKFLLLGSLAYLGYAVAGGLRSNAK
jgi:quercetin dioxygenase-like cupin family protein